MSQQPDAGPQREGIFDGAGHDVRNAARCGELPQTHERERGGHCAGAAGDGTPHAAARTTHRRA
ncbi:MAG: hypothetical protein ACRD1U_07860, partial [Vicinamibacterales bacterium]